MRKALIVGINHYQYNKDLFGCAYDAMAVADVLETHGDGAPNFDIKSLLAKDPESLVKRSDLRAEIKDLFSGEMETALFYFAGHGHVEETGGYLLASDAESGDDGIPLADVLTWANLSPATNRIIILDSCHSGVAGSRTADSRIAEVKEGTTIITASTKEQYATEETGSGVFTSLFVDALEGSAANLVGEVTPGSVYAHIDQSLGAWEQRPVFKANVKKFVSLRRVTPPISLPELRRIDEFFRTPMSEYRLDPSYEPVRSSDDADLPPPDPEKTAIFAILQKYNRVNLVVPVDAPHMWHAAMNSKSCRLTALGEHYLRLRQKKRF
jgi:hypothetical protein